MATTIRIDRQCQGVTPFGARCTEWAEDGQPYCATHAVYPHQTHCPQCGRPHGGTGSLVGVRLVCRDCLADENGTRLARFLRYYASTDGMTDDLGILLMTSVRELAIALSDVPDDFTAHAWRELQNAAQAIEMAVRRSEEESDG